MAITSLVAWATWAAAVLPSMVTILRLINSSCWLFFLNKRRGKVLNLYPSKFGAAFHRPLHRRRVNILKVVARGYPVGKPCDPYSHRFQQAGQIECGGLPLHRKIGGEYHFPDAARFQAPHQLGDL